MPAKAQIFCRLFKIDEEKRLVYGRATEECIDRSGEVMDYKSSKPLFEKWSAECNRDSGGKSWGNLRAMHGNIAAGRLDDIHFDDDAKAIDIVAHVVDDKEWNKVEKGVYTGFSVGGDYVKKWADKFDGKKVTRFTAGPAEVSLVDRPCVPTAKFFDIQKADGSTEQRAFKFTEPTDATSGIAGYGSGSGRRKKPVDKTATDADIETPTAKKFHSSVMRKGCEGVAALADLIQRLKWLADGQAWERDYEGDESDLPEKLKASARDLLKLLAAMAIEEGDELVLPPKDVDNPAASSVLYRSDPDRMGKDLGKFLGIDLAKVGRRNSSSDTSLIQQAHDCLGKLGAACKAAEPKDGPITEIEESNMSQTAAEKLAKVGAGAPTMGGTSGGPSGSEVESANAKAAKDDMAEAAAAKAAKGGDEDDETPEEKKARLAARKSKKNAEAAKAAGLPANGEELQGLLAKAAEQGAETALKMFAKAIGIDPDGAAPTAADPALAKAAPAAAAPAEPAKRAAPALFAVDKGGTSQKMDLGELAKSVEPVASPDKMTSDVATMIKAVRSQGPGWYENASGMGRK